MIVKQREYDRASFPGFTYLFSAVLLVGVGIQPVHEDTKDLIQFV